MGLVASLACSEVFWTDAPPHPYFHLQPAPPTSLRLVQVLDVGHVHGVCDSLDTSA